MPSRRRLLASVGVFGASALAGCVGDDSDGSTPVPDELLADRVPPDEFPDRARVAVVAEALRTALPVAFSVGVADTPYAGADESPIDPTVDEALLRHDGETYEVAVSTAFHAEYGADVVEHDGSWTPEDDRAVVAYDDLSAAERAAFDHALDVGQFESGGHFDPPWGTDWPSSLPPVRYEGAVYEFEDPWVGDPPQHSTVFARDAPGDAAGPVHDVAFPSLSTEVRGVLAEVVDSGSVSLASVEAGATRDELERLVADYDFVAFEEYYRLSVLTTDD